MRQKAKRQRAAGSSAPSVGEETPPVLAEARTGHDGQGRLPAHKTGGISMTRRHAGYTMEIHTDCHGDYNRCTIQLTRVKVAHLRPLFERFGPSVEYLPGIRKLERPFFYTILFSEPENAIFITLRKNASSGLIDEFEAIVAAQCC